MEALPVEVFRDQILPFLSLKELVRLDTATCSRKTRPRHLECIQGGMLIGNLNHEFDSGELAWLYQKKLSLQNVYLKVGVMDTSVAGYSAVFAKSKNCIFSTTIMTNEGMVIFANNCPGLESLTFKSHQYMSDDSVAYLSTHCLKLQSLDIWMNNRDVDMVSKQCKHLHTLNLSDSGSINNDALVSLSANGKGLRSLNVSWRQAVTNVGIYALAGGCKLLEVLILDNCNYITYAAVMDVLIHCTLLHTLSVVSCQGLTREGFTELIPLCKSLKVLKLSGDLLASEQSLIILAAHCAKLESLSILRCTFATDVAIISLVQQCTALCTLDLDMGECWRSTADVAIEQFQLATHCSNLRNLDLTLCSMLTDASINELSQNCNELVSLSVLGCPRVSVAALTNLLRNCPKLQYLGFNQFTNSSYEALAELVGVSYPHVKLR